MPARILRGRSRAAVAAEDGHRAPPIADHRRLASNCRWAEQLRACAVREANWTVQPGLCRFQRAAASDSRINPTSYNASSVALGVPNRIWPSSVGLRPSQVDRWPDSSEPSTAACLTRAELQHGSGENVRTPAPAGDLVLVPLANADHPGPFQLPQMVIQRPWLKF